MNRTYNFIMLVTGCIIQLLTLFLDVGDGVHNIAIAPIALGALALGGGAALNSWANSQNRENAEYSLDMQKRLMDYEWKNFNSPKAQAASLAEAGFNPSVAFGQGGMRSVAPSGSGPELAQSDIGLSGQDFANTILALSEAKKAGSETAGVNLDNILKSGTLGESINSVALDNASKRFELELKRWFGAPEKAANLALAWKNAVLKDDEHSINEFKKLSEQYISELKGIERDSAQKVYDNMDTVIEQQNRQREEDIKLTQEKQKTERTSQTANTASAEASRATAKNQLSQAEVNKENRRIQAALADFEETAKPYKITSYIKELKAKNAISESDYNEAILKLDRLQDVIESRNSSEIYSGVDSFSEWLKGKVSIFGALK